MELLPWNDEKRDLVASSIKTEFRPEQDSTFRAYIVAALAVIRFRESHGSWPRLEDQKAVESSAELHGDVVSSKVADFTQAL